MVEKSKLKEKQAVDTSLSAIIKAKDYQKFAENGFDTTLIGS